MNRRGVLCEEVYHVLQFPSPALSVSGNMGIISACGTYCIGTWQAPLCIRGTKIGKVRELYKWKNRRESSNFLKDVPNLSIEIKRVYLRLQNELFLIKRLYLFENSLIICIFADD